MEERFIDVIYETVIGERETEYMLPGIENSFEPGSLCDKCYEQVYQAYNSLLQRLGKESEDNDIETIIQNMLIIQKEVAYQMYRYGVYYGLEDRLN